MTVRGCLKEKFGAAFFLLGTRNSENDLVVPPLVEDDAMHVRLFLNTEGVVVQKSASESAYPVWIATADLPPVLCSKFENFVLCSLWYGSGECPWDDYFESYKEQLLQTSELLIDNQTFSVKFKTIFIVADLVCNSSVLKMKRHNGFFGCNLCEMRGKHRFPAHCYPTCENVAMMKPEEQYRRSVYFESDEVDFKKPNKEADLEVNSKGVLCYHKIF